MLLYMLADSSDIACRNGVWLLHRSQCWIQDAQTDISCIDAQSSGAAVLQTTLDVLLLAQETRVRTHADQKACMDAVTLRARAHGCC